MGKRAKSFPNCQKCPVSHAHSKTSPLALLSPIETACGRAKTPHPGGCCPPVFQGVQAPIHRKKPKKLRTPIL
jgi:hypothetical protein